MTTKTWVKTDKKGRMEEWSWEETPQVLAALANYRSVVADNKVKALL